MSTDLEDRLTRALNADASAAPPAGDLLAGVHTRARRRRRHRDALTASVAGLAVVLGSVAVANLPAHGHQTLRVPNVGAHPSDGPLVEGAAPALPFPFTPGWLPPGVVQTPRVSMGQGGVMASYRDARGGPDGDLEGVQLWSSDHDVTFSGDGVTRHTTTYAGHPAVLATMDDAVALGWQLVPGKWRMVATFNRWGDEKVARRVADTLLEQAFEAAAPFTMRLVPRDSELADWATESRLVFVPRGQVKQWRDGPEVAGSVQIAVRRASSELTGHGDTVTVQGHPGWLLRESSGRKTLVVQLTDQTCLVIYAPDWSDDDVLRLGEATHYNGGLPPQEG